MSSFSQNNLEYHIIETDDELDAWVQNAETVSHFCFDTEFVGEKRFYTLLCLIQVQISGRLFLIDCMKIKDITPFLRLIENPNILKITHAGDNDYRLLNQLFGTVPKNIFDTQVATGFIGTTYPISFQKLVEKELNQRVKKGFTVTDWDARPMKHKHIEYALNDVLFLEDLWTVISKKLEKKKRMSWLKEEMSDWESEEYYFVDIHKEALGTSVIHQLSRKEQAFLIRLYYWRRNEAERQNISKEMAFPAKYIMAIVKGINEGKDALLHNRLIPDKVLNNNWDNFNRIYNQKITDEEKKLLDSISNNTYEDNSDSTTQDFLYWLVQQKCQAHQVAITLVLNKSDLKKHPDNQRYFNDVLAKSWRKELLGEDLLEWIKHHQKLSINMNGNECVIKMDF